MGVLRVGDELLFQKKYLSYGGIEIKHTFKVIEVKKDWTLTVEGNRIRMEVDDLDALEKKIMDQGLKQKISECLTNDRENFINKLKEFNVNKKKMGRNSRLDDALKSQSNPLETIFKEQEPDLYPERNFSIYINYSNPNINTDTNRNVVIYTKIKDYIDKYLK